MHMPYLKSILLIKRLTIFLQHRVATKLKFVQNINICKDHYNKVYLHLPACSVRAILHWYLIWYQEQQKSVHNWTCRGESTSPLETTDQAQTGPLPNPKTHAPAGAHPGGTPQDTLLQQKGCLGYCSEPQVPTHLVPGPLTEVKHHWGSKDLCIMCGPLSFTIIRIKKETLEYS